MELITYEIMQPSNYPSEVDYKVIRKFGQAYNMLSKTKEANPQVVKSIMTLQIRDNSKVAYVFNTNKSDTYQALVIDFADSEWGGVVKRHKSFVMSMIKQKMGVQKSFFLKLLNLASVASKDKFFGYKNQLDNFERALKNNGISAPSKLGKWRNELEWGNFDSLTEIAPGIMRATDFLTEYSQNAMYTKMTANNDFIISLLKQIAKWGTLTEKQYESGVKAVRASKSQMYAQRILRMVQPVQAQAMKNKFLASVINTAQKGYLTERQFVTAETAITDLLYKLGKMASNTTSLESSMKNWFDQFSKQLVSMGKQNGVDVRIRKVHALFVVFEMNDGHFSLAMNTTNGFEFAQSGKTIRPFYLGDSVKVITSNIVAYVM